MSNRRVYEKNANKISLSFEVPHESGSLYQKLSHFIYNGINMNKIESRPVQGKAWEYRFFVDIEGNLRMRRDQCTAWLKRGDNPPESTGKLRE